MNTDIEVLRRAKSQLQQLQGYVDEFYDLCGTVAGLQECGPLVQKADMAILELRDRWSSVQTLIKHESSAAASAEEVKAAWQVHEAKSWGTRAHDHSSAALSTIQQHLRTHIKLPPTRTAEEHAAKRARTDARGAAMSAELQAVIQRVRQAVPAAELHYFCAHLGVTGAPDAANEIRLVLPKVLVACISLAATASTTPIRVALDSAEKKADAYGWGHQSQLVFRRVTALASRALCYYTMRAQSQHEQPGGPSQGAVVLEDLLLWLCSYQDLFTRPCEATGKLLAWDPSTHYPIPPTFRPYMLTRAELQKCASDPSNRKAYHLHHAPVELLSWQEEGHGRPAAAEDDG